MGAEAVALDLLVDRLGRRHAAAVILTSPLVVVQPPVLACDYCASRYSGQHRTNCKNCGAALKSLAASRLTK